MKKFIHLILAIIGWLQRTGWRSRWRPLGR